MERNVFKTSSVGRDEEREREKGRGRKREEERVHDTFIFVPLSPTGYAPAYTLVRNLLRGVSTWDFHCLLHPSPSPFSSANALIAVCSETIQFDLNRIDSIIKYTTRCIMRL